jgi:sialic acid synthase SpsE
MRVQIVAELAQGFEGCPEQARLLLRAAAAAGADAAKYQLVYADELSTPDYKYYDLFRSLEMPDEVWSALSLYAKEQNIELHLDIFGSRSLALAEKISAQAVKLHGTDIANIGLLDEVAQTSLQRVF